MIKKIIAILVLCAPAFALVCTSQGGGGNFNVIGTWSCGQIPTTADSVVIASGNNVTVPNGYATNKVTGITFTGSGSPTLTVASGGTLNFGTMTLNGATVLFHAASGSTVNGGTNTATNNTIDQTITLGTFTLDNGSTFTDSGSIKCGPTGTCNLNGHFISAPVVQTIHQVIQGNSNSTGSSLISIVGASHASPAVIETIGQAGVQNSGQNLIIQPTSGSSVSDLVMNHVILNNVGDSGATGFSLNWTLHTVPGSITMNDVLFNNFGRVQIGTDSGDGNATTFSMTNIDFRNPNPAASPYMILSTTNANVPSAPRIISGITCDFEKFDSTPMGMSITGSNFNFGTSTLAPSSDGSDTSGGQLFNCQYGGTGINQTFKNTIIALDQTSGATAVLLFGNQGNSNVTIENSAEYFHATNQKGWGNNAAGASTQDFWLNNLADGDMYSPADAGEMCDHGGTYTCSYNIDINGNVNIGNNSQATSLNTVYTNNLVWNQAGFDLGETVGIALSLHDYYDNLFPCPLCLVDGTTFPPDNTCGGYKAGIAIASNFVTQTNMNEDYNWRFNFLNAGDPLSPTCVNGSTSVAPFPGIFSSSLSTSRGVTALTNKASTAGTTCSGTCTLVYATGGFTAGTGEQPTQVNDLVYNNTNTQWTTVGTVTDNTHLALNANPLGLPFTIASGNNFTISKGMWQDHSAIGSATNRGLNDVHADPALYNPRVSICTWYNSLGNALTCPTVISASGVTDANIVAIMHTMITSNGWDYGSAGSLTGTNCSSACPAPVTPWAHTTTELLKYMGQNYRVYNGMAKNAGHTGNDVGPAWQANYPPATMQSF